MKRILLLVTVLILYGSFYPWQFHARLLPANPFWILLHAWPSPFLHSDYLDAAINVPLYVPFGAFCYLSLTEAWPRTVRALMTLLTGVLLSASVEVIQLFDSGRVTSLFDLLCNTIGTVLGVVVASTFPGVISQAVSGVESAGAFNPSAAIALVYLWAGFELFPFLPSLRFFLLRSKLASLLDPNSWPIRDGFENLCGWLALAFVMESFAGRSRAVWLLPAAILAIPLKLMISGRTMTGYEVAGAVLGITLWAILGKSVHAKLAAGSIALGALVAAGLIPFHLTHGPQPFNWVPFMALLQAPWEAAFRVVLEKSFLYGATVWLLHQGGRGWLSSSILVAVPLALVEAAQTYLPGRTPEITDPLIALLLGASLMALDRRQPQLAPEPLRV